MFCGSWSFTLKKIGVIFFRKKKVNVKWLLYHMETVFIQNSNTETLCFLFVSQENM